MLNTLKVIRECLSWWLIISCQKSILCYQKYKYGKKINTLVGKKFDSEPI